MGAAGPWGGVALPPRPPRPTSELIVTTKSCLTAYPGPLQTSVAIRAREALGLMLWLLGSQQRNCFGTKLQTASGVQSQGCLKGTAKPPRAAPGSAGGLGIWGAVADSISPSRGP